MSDNMMKFPITHRQRLKNMMGSTSVTCQVSGRYLKFHENSALFESGKYITVDVMPEFEEGKNAKRICQLVVTREELMEALKHVTPSE